MIDFLSTGRQEFHPLAALCYTFMPRPKHIHLIPAIPSPHTPLLSHHSPKPHHLLNPTQSSPSLRRNHHANILHPIPFTHLIHDPPLPQLQPIIAEQIEGQNLVIQSYLLLQMLLSIPAPSSHPAIISRKDHLICSVSSPVQKPQPATLSTQ